MRKTFFWLFIIALIGLGGIIMYGKATGESLPLPILSLTSSIAPTSEWESIMIGKWKFKTVFKSLKEAEVWEGEVEYFPDGKMERYVTYKNYGQNGGEARISDDYVNFIAGGKAVGAWSVKNTEEVWVEVVSDCFMTNSYVGYNMNEEFNACYDFPKGEKSPYGNQQNEIVKLEIKQFSKQKIIIEGKDFSNNGKRTYTFKRI